MEGDRPGERRITCVCGWRSESGPEPLDLDVHFAEVNGISYEEQKKRTAASMRRVMGVRSPDLDPDPDPKPMN